MDTSKQNEAVVAAATVAMRRHKADQRVQGPTVVMPGGKVVSAIPYLENQFRYQKQADVFGDIDRNQSKYLKEHRPGFRYIWVNMKDADTQVRIRTGRYMEILEDELLPDSELPYIPGTVSLARLRTHKGVSKAVEIYDVRLCSVSPKAWDELFTARESMAIARIASDTDSFYGNMEREGAVASVEVSNEKGEIL